MICAAMLNSDFPLLIVSRSLHFNPTIIIMFNFIPDAYLMLVVAFPIAREDIHKVVILKYEQINSLVKIKIWQRKIAVRNHKVRFTKIERHIISRQTPKVAQRWTIQASEEAGDRFLIELMPGSRPL